MSEADKQRAHERAMAREAARANSGYYNGNTMMGGQGQYMDQGVYNNNNGGMGYNQGPGYLETMAIAAAAGYVATKFIPQNNPTVEVDNQGHSTYKDKKGNSISKSEYDRRKAQSNKAKEAHRAKEQQKLDNWKKKPENKQKYTNQSKKVSKKKNKNTVGGSKNTIKKNKGYLNTKPKVNKKKNTVGGSKNTIKKNKHSKPKSRPKNTYRNNSKSKKRR